MGHARLPDRTHRLLQERLDRSLTGAPYSPALIRILKLLFSEREADLARRLPGRPTPLSVLSRRLGMPADELDGKLTEMARRGVVVDISRGGRRWFMLPPIVIGFFEYTFMRARKDVPMAELAKLFHEYMSEDDRFARSVFQGSTQLGRALVREESLPEGDHTEVLDYERASRLVETASAAAVSLCACRHKAEHLGRACGKPVEVCLTLNHGAQALSRMGSARSISTREAVKVLERSKEAGLAQTGDNVKRKVGYICNCCGCCCGMMDAIRTFDIRGAIVSSNWIMEVDADRCKGCGECVKACPVRAVSLSGKKGDKRRRAERDEGLCLGCGVCVTACRSGAASMRPRARRVFTPETVFDQYVHMAVERGKLAELLFDEPEKLGHRAVGRILGVLERTPIFKAAMAVAPLKSVFLDAVVKGAKKSAKGAL